MLDLIVKDLGKGPLPRQEWGNTCDEGGADCVRCPARIENEDRDADSGNALVGGLALFGIGVVIGAGSMILVWFLAVQK